jgi:hypothetical protein
MGFLGDACGNAAIVASMDTKCSRVTTVRSSGPVGCSGLLGAPGTAMSRRLTVLCLSHAAFPQTAPYQALFFLNQLVISNLFVVLGCWPNAHKNPFRVPALALELIYRPIA